MSSQRSAPQLDERLLAVATRDELEEFIALSEHLAKPSPYVPHFPQPKQALFLSLDCDEALYGGAAGGGKSDALLMDALRDVNHSTYSAMLLRRTFSDLKLPGALMDRADEWLQGTDAIWHDRDHTWEFPSGATLTFGYLERPRDIYRYQSAEFQMIGFDELTQFDERQYTYLFSRLRRVRGSKVKPRMRAASNPGGAGHEWVKRRFIPHDETGSQPRDMMKQSLYRTGNRAFVPATVRDNSYIDEKEYAATLENLDPITRAQLLRGLWVRPEGGMFKRAWFHEISVQQSRDTDYQAKIRRWDLAATTDGDYTAGVLLGLTRDNDLHVINVVRTRSRAHDVEIVVAQTAWADGIDIPIMAEQEPGASGLALMEHYQRDVLAGFHFRYKTSTGSKELRAGPIASAAQAGRVAIVQGEWNTEFLAQLEAFPEGEHDDQVDALSLAYVDLMHGRRSMYVAPVSITRSSPWRVG
jgi:predicted phage terminase large subunit-like protein